MNGVFELPTLLFLVLAVIVIARLVSVLGRKTGHERPYDQYRRSAEAPQAGAGNDNVVQLPRADARAPMPPPATSDASDADRIKGASAPAGSPLEQGLLDIARNDASFEIRHFLKGAKTAHEMIVVAFAEGNRRQLRTLASKEVFDGFIQAIVEREGRGETNETHFVGIDRVDVLDAELKGKNARITVKFVCQLITTTRDRAGTIIEGDPKQVRSLTDIWTFARDLTSGDPNWKLVATQSPN